MNRIERARANVDRHIELEKNDCYYKVRDRAERKWNEIEFLKVMLASEESEVNNEN